MVVGKIIGPLSQIQTVALSCASGLCIYCCTLGVLKKTSFLLKNVLDEAVETIYELSPTS